MDALLHFLSIVVICISGLIALTLVLLVAICYLPDNPLKDILKAIAKRLGATAAMAVLALPIEAIPVFDVLYDIGAAIFLLLYWYDLIKTIHSIRRSAPPRKTMPAALERRVQTSGK